MHTSTRRKCQKEKIDASRYQGENIWRDSSKFTEFTFKIRHISGLLYFLFISAFFNTQQQLAEDASKAAKADDIFEFQKDQGARTFLTVGRRNHQNSTDSTTLSQSSSSAVTNISPLKGFKILDGLEDLEDLESPNAAGVTIPHEREGRTIKRTGLRNNNASYIHTLSKKMSAKVGKSSTTGASLSSIINIKGRKGKASVNGVIGTFSPRSGKILIGIPRVVKNSGRMDEDEDEVAVDSDAYNQNLSEEEDGDF